ncbi:helix-turn-helix domain-containing protein [Aquibacillus halophilus]|uniref:Helix-turn-helix domain-containing protein n=1 Tax=Aquibacillus halophilus TaxID=930132 RepID=A0A6A8DCQ4_9BACI|nr:helix-turn-helix transcriptional regulator [Aquibacillus halophilus]MRH43334.1 helix-turn-helix domain-containing protein [Aquibacillus halophilus]
MDQKKQETELKKQLVGKIIKKNREAAGMTQPQLAEISSIDYKYLGKLEKGIYNPSYLKMFEILNGLKINHDEFKKEVEQEFKKHGLSLHGNL